MFTFHTTTSLTCAELSRLAKDHVQVNLSEKVREKVSRSRNHLERLIKANKIIYGVNTSMGGFVNWIVPTNLAYTLQKNLINAVATNVGEYFSDLEARATMLARINSLAKGNSALSLHILEHLINIYNKGVIPLIPQKGSLGTSGDLGPLACVALVCCGQWRARVKGKEMCGSDALKSVGIAPTVLSYYAWCASCDARHYALEAEIPTIIFGAGNLADAHSSSEKISLLEIKSGILTVVKFLSEDCKESPNEYH